MNSAAPRISDSTPVLVGVGLVSQCEADPARAREPLELMMAAAAKAGVDCGSPQLLRTIDAVYVPRGRWRYQDPGRAIADRVGSVGTQSVLARVGVLQEQLVGRACERILGGEIQVALVVGGEGGHRLLRSRITGQEIADAQQESAPDETWRASDVIMTDAEMASGLGRDAPAYYAILDSALRAERGTALDAHRDAVAELYSGFSRIASENPHAWRRTVVEPAAIRDASEKNPMLAFPYTKMHTSDWSVDQASALLLCSAAQARAWGVPMDKWVFPLVTAASNSMTAVSERAALDRSPGAEIAARRALDHVGIASRQVDFIDLYSCFPVAVLHHAEAAGLDLQAALTLSGGMRFAGGPFNNYVLHTTAQLAQHLRRSPASTGLISSVSGVLTKHAFSIWTSAPRGDAYEYIDVTDEVDRVTETKVLDPGHVGSGQVAGYTVIHEKGGPSRGVALIDTASGVRTLASTEDPSVLAAMTEREFTGTPVHADGGQLLLRESVGYRA